MSADLYQQRMLQLAAGADSAGRLEAPAVTVTLDNPLCGDRVRIDLRCSAEGRIEALSHEVRGCVLCRAAAALLGAHAAGHDARALHAVRTGLHAGLRGEGPWPEADAWPELEVFQPVAAHKSRHECVLLPFDAMLAALEQCADPADAHGRPAASSTGT